MGEKISSGLLIIMGTADFIVAAAYAWDGRNALCLVYVAYAVSQYAMAWV